MLTSILTMTVTLEDNGGEPLSVAVTLSSTLPCSLESRNSRSRSPLSVKTPVFGSMVKLSLYMLGKILYTIWLFTVLGMSASLAWPKNQTIRPMLSMISVTTTLKREFCIFIYISCTSSKCPVLDRTVQDCSLLCCHGFPPLTKTISMSLSFSKTVHACFHSLKTVCVILKPFLPQSLGKILPLPSQTPGRSPC